MSDWGPFSIGGKSAIVTGGAMGIGFGIAKRFVEGGANVLIADLDAGAAKAAAERLAGGPGRAVPMGVDVGADDAADAIVARCLDALGGLDVLVNNAGIYPQVPVLEMSREVFDKVIRVNLRALVFLSKAAAKHMVAKGSGKIVNVGSIDSLHPSMVGLAAYDGSKGGVLMFTRGLALELAPKGIQVNVILPGGVATEGTARPLAGSGMTEAQMRAVMDTFIRTKIPMGRMGVPDDIAKAAVFLASSGSDYMTGAEIVVDGGTLLA